jgi:hypothetical protein
MASKIIHKHSSVITDGIPKLPTKDQLEYGELAINYSASAETITLRNSSDEIVEFKSKEYYENILNENNYGIASAINYLDDKKQNILVDGETIKTINGESILGNGNIEINAETLGLSSALKYCGITTTELIEDSTASTITIDGKEHIAESGCVVFYNKKEFIFNGSVWNELGYPTDLSGKQDVIDDLDDIRNNATLARTALQSVPSKYATKSDLSSITSMIEDNEYAISVSLTDLNENKQDKINQQESINELNQFITQFETMRKMMKGLGGFMKGAKKGKMPFGLPKFPF